MGWSEMGAQVNDAGLSPAAVVVRIPIHVSPWISVGIRIRIPIGIRIRRIARRRRSIGCWASVPIRRRLCIATVRRSRISF